MVRKSPLPFDCLGEARRYRSAYDSEMHKNRAPTLPITLELHLRLQTFPPFFLLATLMLVSHNDYS